jgi:ADP-ribosyl-[dinitrogen reductase] hydrolase
METNRQRLESLFEIGGITLGRGEFFDRLPQPLPAGLDFERVQGLMLGLAIGDALGNTTEDMLPDQRRAACGEIQDHLPNACADQRPVGLPSDDTQLAFVDPPSQKSDDRPLGGHGTVGNDDPQ